ncbi:sodium:calcium antiporter [Aurantiacibacter xanthus]|uniref:Sodium:calcium antiporter n=1 Tax=Aurantiacibacter xanthus TaxID=1784712 RepID=A0A3A1PCI8_9SPHN|nr:calcium/sodium antiporter [Aurantiacibacter xanthus]RIV91513.1 sodium:calcium antiporter [Aurantiacibacter xanthus]
MMLSILAVLGGLIALAVGGELLVRGAVGISRMLGISPLITGLVVVGAATSMPELVASVQAAMLGSPGIAWGNIVGSNIANSLLILGAAALIAPIAMRGIGKRDALIGLLAALVLWLVTYGQWASPVLGMALLASLVAYILWRLRQLPDTGEDDDDHDDGDPIWWLALLQFGGGLAALVGGGDLLVGGAIELAQMAGVSQTAIGLTVVAVGTSLPELAATAAAALRGRSELAIGNVVGSNLFNLLLIGGVTMTIAPQAVPIELVDIEWPVLVASALLILGLCRYARRLGRGLGLVLLAGFAANTAVVFVL